VEPPAAVVLGERLLVRHRQFVVAGHHVRSGDDDFAGDVVDVVLLDRRLPDLSGDDFLDALRDQDYDCYVAMVSAVDPDLDILEMAFDDYLTKPVTKDELYRTIERLLALEDYDDRAKEHFSLAQKLATLEAEKSKAELEGSEEYLEMRERLDTVRDELDDLVAHMDERASTLLFRELNRESEE